MHRCPGQYRCEGLAHNAHLPLDTVGKLGPVPAADPETEVGSEQATDVYFLESALVLLCVDHPYAGPVSYTHLDVYKRQP